VQVLVESDTVSVAKLQWGYRPPDEEPIIKGEDESVATIANRKIQRMYTYY
jgi:hypothetical protein